jgi:hypothetical protein
MTPPSDVNFVDHPVLSSFNCGPVCNPIPSELDHILLNLSLQPHMYPMWTLDIHELDSGSSY